MPSAAGLSAGYNRRHRNARSVSQLPVETRREGIGWISTAHRRKSAGDRAPGGMKTAMDETRRHPVDDPVATRRSALLTFIPDPLIAVKLHLNMSFRTEL
jgi:hypothetical protein